MCKLPSPLVLSSGKKKAPFLLLIRVGRMKTRDNPSCPFAWCACRRKPLCQGWFLPEHCAEATEFRILARLHQWHRRNTSATMASIFPNSKETTSNLLQKKKKVKTTPAIRKNRAATVDMRVPVQC